MEKLSGNIPAHAGKTCGAPYTPAPNQEHPRARGENVAFPFRHRGFQGTSPRTRGKHSRQLWWKHHPGNIPAHAGKTTAVVCCPPPRTGNIPAHAGKTGRDLVRFAQGQEHPRARGENTIQDYYPIGGTGTSPRTRGKRTPATCLPDPHRNIPAHAGKTHTCSVPTGSASEHPRARGENVDGVGWGGEFFRNIPAHAGKTYL